MLLAGALAATPLEVDPFNTYQFNRRNVLEGNGQIDRGPWFEWWYYKVVLPERGESFYFIYGVVNPWDTEGTSGISESYVGMGDFSRMVLLNETHPASAFTADYYTTHVQVGEAVATHQNLQGSLTSPEQIPYRWNIDIEKRWAFNAMSWATGRNVTNIDWYPAQGDARCSGEVVRGEEHIRFENAPCYQDRNWGRSFPRWWTWIVSNTFEGHPESALVAGGGKPTIFRLPPVYEGVSLGLNHNGRVYKFRPQDLDPVWTDVNFGRWEVQAENGSHRIEVSASAPPQAFQDLQFKTPQGEVFHDYETLDGELTVRLYRRRLGSWQLMDTLISHHAGIEYGASQP